MRNRRLGQLLDEVFDVANAGRLTSICQVGEDVEARLVTESLENGNERRERPLARLARRRTAGRPFANPGKDGGQFAHER